MRAIEYGRAGRAGPAAAAAPASAPASASASAPASRRMVVFLPGRGDSAVTFDGEGFISAAKAAGLDADLVAADARLGYYMRRTIADRLWTDVLAPAVAAGYTEIWLVGISMGGLGAIAVAREHPGALAGIVLLAPYLGERDVVDEVAAAGGLARWTPPAAPAPDDFHSVWKWLRGYVALPAGPPALWLGYGDLDRYRSAHALLAAVLPRDRVLTTRGGHDWDAWRALWKELLARGALGGAGAAARPAGADDDRRGCAASPAADRAMR
jgi:pimeloyl-ACP methyl ester carboxylesterase